MHGLFVIIYDTYEILKKKIKTPYETIFIYILNLWFSPTGGRPMGGQVSDGGDFHRKCHKSKKCKISMESTCILSSILILKTNSK